MNNAQIHAYDGMLNAVPLPILVVAQNNRITFANAASKHIFDHDIIGLPYVTAIRQPALLHAIERAIDSHALQAATYIARSDHSETVYLAHVNPVADTIMISFEDQSAKRETDQFRRHFVANVSHELRTPLTALMGFIETLQGPAQTDSAAQQKFLSVMAVEAERMRVLIDDLLSLSKVEEMERVQPSTIVNLNEIIRSVILSLAPLSQEADVPIHFENAVDPLHVQGDDGQLRQVFMNLIGNAIKYAPSKQGITIQTQHIAQDLLLRSPAYQITVADFGDGIAAHHIARLTERFYRVDTHRSRAVGGTGLGLAIVKHIINRHRGRLNITSTEGKGSRFTIILPQRRDTNTL